VKKKELLLMFGVTFMLVGVSMAITKGAFKGGGSAGGRQSADVDEGAASGAPVIQAYDVATMAA